MSWAVHVGTTAQNDFTETVAWTAKHFGKRQATAYAQTLIAAMNALHAGPRIPGAREREEIGKGIYTLHVARMGRKGRHFVMFRVVDGVAREIEVLRLLHDAMDLTRHLPPSP